MYINNRNPIAEKNALRQTQDTAEKTFNRGILNLINIACDKNKKNSGLAATKELFRAINATEPSIIVTQAGPYFYKFRDSIRAKHESFFLNGDFSGEIAEQYAIDDDNETFSESEVLEILQAIKRTWHLLSVPEREVVWKHAVSILGSYAQVLICGQKILKINKEIQALRK